MTSQQSSRDEGAEPAYESDALRLSDIAGRDAAETAEPPGLVEEEQEIAARDGARRIVLIVAAVGAAAAVVVGLKIAYDRRKASQRCRARVGGRLHDAKDSVAVHFGDAKDAVVHRLGDARGSVVSAAAELPGRGRDALHHLTHR